ncbi:MAG: sensor histidine kinase [Verrucomicrobia bacterium]|nr:sensor histidine kinase [Verrucomicrobiota bacterium]
MKPTNSTKSATELRRLAESRLQKTASLQARHETEADLQRIRHELEVHQIELEIQNEELQQAQRDTDFALGKYADLYDFAPIGYFTLDTDGIILGVNLTGALLVGIERARLVRRRFSHLVATPTVATFNDFLRRAFESEAIESCEVALRRESGAPMHLRIEGIVSPSGTECRVVALDISERHLLAAQRDELILSLQRALAEVKQLSGLLPICASCKQIRDGLGEWRPVEEYVSAHSEANFTHSLCPECIPKYYPELEPRKGPVK